MAIAFPRSSVGHISLKTPPPIYHSRPIIQLLHEFNAKKLAYR